MNKLNLQIAALAAILLLANACTAGQGLTGMAPPMVGS